MISKIKDKLGFNDFEWKRLSIWILAGLTYAIYYFGRYNFSAAHPSIAQDLHWNTTDYGVITSLALLVYSVCIFFHGPVVDKIGSKKALIIGAVGSGIANFVFGLMNWGVIKGWIHIGARVEMLKFIQILAIIWAANSYFQTFGAISIVKLNTTWFQLHERAKQAGRFGALIQLGRVAVLLICPLLLLLLPWHWVFWVPSVLLFTMAGLVYKYIKDKPEDFGYQYFDTPTKPTEEIKISKILKKVFMSRIMLCFALISFCIGITRNTIDQWFSKFYTAYYHITPSQLIHQPAYKFYAVAMPAFVISAGFFGGWISSRLDNKRVPVFGISFIGQLLMILLLGFSLTNPWAMAITVCALMFFVQMGHCMIGGAVAQDWGGRKAAGTAIALFDGVQYLGGAIITLIIGKILNKHGANSWYYWTLIPIPTIIIGFLTTLPIWSRKPEEKHE
jgi:OPA family glycerol-3-phosphate transporter-like MFS transporter